MNQIKMIVKKLLYPPKWFLFTVPTVVFAALIFIFVTDRKESTAAYIIYCMSAYSLTISILALFQSVRKIKVKFPQSRIIRRIEAFEIGKRYLNDRVFRGTISIYQGFIVNTLYMVFRIITGICYTSVWFISIAVYYMVLGMLRAYLIACYRKAPTINNDDRLTYEYNCYRRIAIFLFLLNIPMGGMIVLMVRTNSGFSYPGYVIYLSAIYAFYAIIMSIINLVKYRKLGSPVLSAAKVLNFIAALMSILGLQTAMISRFSENGDGYRMMMNAITGGCVFATVVSIAVYMLFLSTKMKNQRKEVSADE